MDKGAKTTPSVGNSYQPDEPQKPLIAEADRIDTKPAKKRGMSRETKEKVRAAFLAGRTLGFEQGLERTRLADDHAQAQKKALNKILEGGS